MLVGRFDELRVVGQEGQVRCPNRPVSVLGDDHFGNAVLFVVVLAVDVFPVKESNQIGVLLDVSRIAEVGEHRALVGAALIGSREL